MSLLQLFIFCVTSYIIHSSVLLQIEIANMLKFWTSDFQPLAVYHNLTTPPLHEMCHFTLELILRNANTCRTLHSLKDMFHTLLVNCCTLQLFAHCPLSIMAMSGITCSQLTNQYQNQHQRRNREGD